MITFGQRTAFDSLALTSTSGLATNGITFGGDTTLYRSSAGLLKTDGSAWVAGNLGIGMTPVKNLDVNGNGRLTGFLSVDDINSTTQGVLFGSAGDTSLFRSASAVLKAGQAFHVTTDFRHLGANLGFFNAAQAAKQTVTGSRGANAALASLLTALAAYGFVTDSSTA